LRFACVDAVETTSARAPASDAASSACWSLALSITIIP
jgi:hypothetical protein